MPLAEAFCRTLSPIELDDSYRIFNCARCAKQTILCRRCDRGNIYCSKTCAHKQRRRSQKESGRRYQKSFRGRRAHAERQARYKEGHSSVKEVVTHHGSQSLRSNVSLKESKRSKIDARSPQPGARVRCDNCHRLCGSFARFEFWRGGRQFKKLRRLNGHRQTDRGGDHPPVSR